jgi:hypothetical protein
MQKNGKYGNNNLISAGVEKLLMTNEHAMKIVIAL